jgi:hypothetical protein
MASFSNSPRLIKGALVQGDPLHLWRKVVVFQYNPERLTRSLQVPSVSQEGGQAQAPRLTAPPEETLQMEIELDATDPIEIVDGLHLPANIRPMLATLELLVYPSSESVIASEVLTRSGVLEIIPPEAPLTLLVWGVAPPRVLPVQITSYTITEEAFDAFLNPVRATVNLNLRVLNYHQHGLLSPAGATFMAHQLSQESLSAFQAAAGIVSAFEGEGTLGGSGGQGGRSREQIGVRRMT